MMWREGQDLETGHDVQTSVVEMRVKFLCIS